MTNSAQTVRIDLERARALQATLGTGDRPLSDGDPLPHFWHWSQFWDVRRSEDLGRDGHPKLGGIIPDLGLPRRMWAGGRLEFFAPILIGTETTRRTELVSAERKRGRTGPLAFVKLAHDISSAGRFLIREEQDLVYREDARASDLRPEPEQAPTDATETRVLKASTTELFRYSALTFNGHRIHYDLDYAREVEHYEGLVVHGPLLAQRLIALAVEILGDIKVFEFRAVSPIFHFETFTLNARRCADGLDMWVAGPDGRLAMTARGIAANGLVDGGA